MAEWISVKERTPEAAGYDCLVVGVNPFGQRRIFKAFTGYGDGKWYTMDNTKMVDTKARNNEVSDNWKITHWMDLPELPNDETPCHDCERDCTMCGIRTEKED